ncbi:MAG: sugar phosphate nucleotidyltransferase [Blastocatellia bacterium]|nr:sugar phosphate nucleotidyltransferase [Blastocatellia bacterium]MCS7156732.1 sugar phosphate nucleotidyltransferase [Blastocatellia bacterium]MCX7751526.1 sugar phosphate nucleotidyltransferase [Blastocatellia bacterium]MDW8168626.1 sugar phosphate nucleotidyltransferase [Acidobacteriota bacterium]MDW8256521.1 sugar phosphate nucleotidyltransferase [Acidobacteriota bacterium]
MNGVAVTRGLAHQVLTIVLGFGQGARLFPLTAERAKAALPFIGQYRLIDLALSQCLNAGLRRIYVLTQFNSLSLNRHVMQTYRFGRLSESVEFVEVIAAEQTLESQQWYRSPTDAIRRAWRHFEPWPARHILILPGDCVGWIALQDVIAFHVETEADLTLVVVAADETVARTRGVVRVAGARVDSPRPSDWRVLRYQEEPRQDTLREFRMADGNAPYLIATGIYLFRREALASLLEQALGPFDFGLELLPLAVAQSRVYAYWHRGYWEEMSTISAYYDAHMRMLDAEPPLSFYDPNAPLCTRPRYLPPAKIRESEIVNSMIANGSLVTGARIERSMLGLRSRVEKGAHLDGVIAFGAEYFPSPEEQERDRALGLPPIGIGEGAVIRRAILDRNVRIGAGARIVNEAGLQHADGPNYYIREGIVIVPKNSVIPEGQVI